MKLESAALPTAQIVDVYPLSGMQEGLLFHAVAEPDSRAYFVQMRFEVAGTVDEATMAKAWRALFARHDILRTSFRHEGVERPLQVVYAERDPDIVFVDVRSLDATRQGAQIDEWCRGDRARGFDVQRDVLMRVALFQTGERMWHLVWSYHHLLLDGWCLGILAREFLEIYASLSLAREPQLPQPRPYRDYIAWLQAQDDAAAHAHWMQALHGYEQVATLPRGGAAGPADFREHILRLDGELTREITAFAARSRVTLNTVFQVMWALVLARYNDVDDVIFGAVVAGRPAELAGVESMVGPFINTIPVRVKFDPDETFLSALRRVQIAAIESAPFHHSSLSDIQGASPLGRGLFDHLLVFDNYPVSASDPAASAPALAFRALDAHDFTHYDFSIVVAPAAELNLKFLYNANAYDEGTIARVAMDVERIARFLVREPSGPISAIPSLSDVDARDIAVWSGAARSEPAAGTIVEVFETQVERTPEAIALAFGERVLTYRQLNGHANALAARLRSEYGVGAEVRAGILLERSEQMVVAILAVLKAGGAYIPIDPAYPAARITFMLEDGGARVLLCEAKHRAAAPPQIAVLELPIAGLRSENPQRAAESHNLAYVLYTSGTTGNPKGCELEHSSLLFYLEWANSYYFSGPGGGNFGLFSPLAFDLTVTSLFLPLMRGATLRVFAQDREPAAILAEVFDGRHAIDSVKLTPSHLAMLEYLDLTSTPVTLAIVGGEAFTPRHAQLLWNLNPAMRIVNEYGPTEATVGCIVHDLAPAETVVPIGKPIAGSCVALLNRAREPVPIGGRGEIYVGGPGLARGYRNRPELEHERFIDVAGTRMYRTGDYGRWRATGTIEYLGRKDDQVKIRGYRVELGDVESVLERFPGITRAVVLARESSLVAYVESAQPYASAALREHARALLPEFMQPARYVHVACMPLTPNGKVDKARLAALDEDEGSRSGESAARDAAERAVSAIWSDVLGAQDFTLEDNFFERGGHSLKAMQVISRIRKELGVQVELRAFLEQPTIMATAALVRAARPSPFAQIPSVPEAPYYALSHAQERLWLLHGMGGEIAYNMPQAFLFEGDLAIDALRAALAELLQRHEALRTAFIRIEGEPKQHILAQVADPLVEIDLSQEADPEASARGLAERDAQTPFTLERAPLLRFSVMRLAQRRYVLLLTIHHIIGDGWSLTVLHQELMALYEAFRRGKPSPLQPLRIQYKDFSTWQNARDLGASEAYWVAAMRGVPEALRLPYDRYPKTAERDFRGATVRRKLSAVATSALRELASRKKTTLSNLVLSALGVALWQQARQDDFCIGISEANRNDVDLETLIGFFVNILPIRFRLSAQTTLREMLDATISTVYQAFDHQDYPFDLLVRKLNPGRIANRQPLLNVIYGFQSFRDVRIDAGSPAGQSSALADVGQFGVPFRTSKFDLCLFVSEVGQTLVLEMEYDWGLFVPETVERMLAAIETCARLMVENPEDRLDALPLYDVDTIAALPAVNAAATPYPNTATVHELFAAIAAQYPDNVAVAYKQSRLTYAELERRSNQLAAFLLDHGLRAEEFAGVLLDRSPHMIVALLGILKAGAAYAPLGGDMPYERLRQSVDDTQARLLITEKRYLRTANKLQWDCAQLESFICIDAADLRLEIEDDGGIMDSAVWDYIAEETFDDISGGGWRDSYTGEWLSREVMDEYGENIRQKLGPLLAPQSRVLEIGCASGISMFRLAPLAGYYVGTDLSPGIVRWSEIEAKRRGLQNIRLAALPAHEIDRLGEAEFDVVILNSVIECFSGHNYLRSVLRKALAMMKPDGYLFLGNLWDHDLKAAFVQSLIEFKREHPERATRMKLDRSDELSVSRAFIEDLRYEFPEIASIEYSSMLGQAQSELSRFGFDALIRIRKGALNSRATARRREQFDRRALEPFGDAALPTRGTARSLAYMMYTSGTSGRPKGVMIEHRSIVRLVRNTNYIALGPSDAVLQSGALGFDASTFEMWGPLLSGGAVVLPEGKSFLHPADLARLIRENRITTLFLTTGLFNQIIDLDIEAFTGLTTLLTGGEKASAQHFNAVRARFPDLTLQHVYGPTENTTFSTFFNVSGPQERDVPIGAPISNASAIVVDHELRPVPVGIPGELCVGGDGLARGYWRDPDLTARKFIAHPLDPTQRVYRTGDLVRGRADGAIEFIGRIDTQIKIRGYRIELEELESVLLQHESITAAAVLAGNFGSGETELVAFISGRDLDAERVLDYLKAALPEYLVPARIVIQPKLPLNANGKVDRRALVVPELLRASGPYFAPESDIERQLADIWQRLLHQPEISVTANFFALGGHSLRVARMVSMVQMELGVEVPLGAVFRAPTIRELARHIADVSHLDPRLIDDPLVLLNSAQSGQPVFAFAPGSGYCISYLRLATMLPQPLYGLSFIEDETRLDDYVRLLRAAQTRGPYVLFGYSAGGKLAFRVAQELERAGEHVSDVIIFDASRYLQHVSFTESETLEVAAEFLDEITSRVLREQALVRIKKYRAFLGDCIEAGTIAADIHLVVEEESPRIVRDDRGAIIASIDGWRDLTTGTFREYQGSGRHREMLTQPHLERNVDILRAIVPAQAATLLGGVQ